MGDAIREQVKTYRDVDVSNTTPTSKAKVWVNTSTNDTESQDILLPQVDDANISEENTWSSKKIDSEIGEVREKLNYDAAEYSIGDFQTGGINVNGISTSIVVGDIFRNIFLFDVAKINIDSEYRFFVRKFSEKSGLWCDVITVEAGGNYHDEESSTYLIVIQDNTKEFDKSISIKAMSYRNVLKTTGSTFHQGTCYITPYGGGRSTDYIIDLTNKTRCFTDRVLGNCISVTNDPGYQSMLFGMDDGEGLIVYNNWSDSITRKNMNNEYYVVITRKTDGSVIEVGEAKRNTHIKISNIRGEVQVIHFSTTVNNDNNTYHDNGILVLPENYSDPGEGEPIRLAIVCHGAGAQPYDKLSIDSDGKILSDPQRVLTKLGYAVMDTYAMPYDYSGSTTSLHYGNELVLQCYIKAYQYVIKNYNIDVNGVLLTGSSMGGLSMFQIIQNSKIPVLGAVGYCPCIDLFKQAYCNPWSTDQRKNIAKYYGFVGTAPTFTNNCPPSANEIEYFRNNIDKVIGLYPLLFNETNGNINDLLADINLPSHYGYSTEQSAKDISEQQYYNTLKSTINVPIMIIHNEDDGTVLFRYTKYLVEMLKRTGQLVRLKTYSTGGHSAWATGGDVTMTDINGNKFTCKESQKIGVNWLKQFDM